jgi:hypothetical protein
VLVHDDHAGRAEAEAAAAEADVVEVELDVELVGPEHAHRDAAADRALVPPPFMPPARSIDCERDAQLVLVDVGRFTCPLMP